MYPRAGLLFPSQLHSRIALEHQGGRLKTLSAGSLQNLTYQYDSVGNIREIVNSIAPETQTYGYDALNRLTGWTLDGVQSTYTYNAAGNLSTKEGLTLTYGDSSHPHAATAAGSNSYQYDANGNMTLRGPTGQQYTLAYDAEGRLVTVSGPSEFSAAFVYDGDGERVKQVINGTTTYFVGNHYEKTGTTITKYYYTGATRIAMRTGSTVYYLLGDHLGSTSLTTDASGNLISELRYTAWGETRYSSGTTPTTYRYTGQREEASFGFYFYQARWFDPALSRFTSADTIVPDVGDSQALDRYAFVSNNPVRYTDPSGHSWEECNTDGYRCKIHLRQVNRIHQQAESIYHAQSWWYWQFGKGRNYGEQGCTLSLLECYYSSPLQLMMFSENQRIDPNQFQELLIAVYYDIRSMDNGWPIGPNNILRGTFDTPFHNGAILFRDENLGGDIRKIPLPDQRVCISGKCSFRSDINYFAQGMWAAASGQTLDAAYQKAVDWKAHNSAALSVDAKFWIKYGFDRYIDFELSGLFDQLSSQ